VEKPEGNRPLGTPRRSWEDNIQGACEDVPGGGAGPGLICLRTGTGSGHL
jgi:hypothetical protein